MEAKYDINTASKEELMLIEGVSENSALAIMEYKEFIGKITSWYTFKALSPKTSVDNLMDLHDSREWTSGIKDFPFRFKVDPQKDIKRTTSTESKPTTKLGQSTTVTGERCNIPPKEGPLNSINSPPSNVLSSLDKDGIDPSLTTPPMDLQEVKSDPLPVAYNTSVESHYLNFGSKFSNLVHQKLVQHQGRRVSPLHPNIQPHQKSPPMGEEPTAEYLKRILRKSSKKIRTEEKGVKSSPGLSGHLPQRPYLKPEKLAEGDLSLAAGNRSAVGNLSPPTAKVSADGVLSTNVQLDHGTLIIQLPETIIKAVKKIALYKSTGCESNEIPEDSPHSASPSYEDSSSALPSEVPKPRPWKPRTCFECGGAGHLAPHCPTRRQRSILCFECGGAGHPAPQCPSSRLSSIICHQCGGRGHIAKNCAFHHHPPSHFNSRHRLSVRCYECRNYGHIARNCVNYNASTLHAFNCSSYQSGANNYKTSWRSLPNQDFKTGSDSQDWRATMRGRI